MADLATGSHFEIMSTSQSSDVFEGWEGDLVIYDEPPPRDIRIACARGLVDRQGRELFVATLLKEAWIHREVIKARLKDGKVDPRIFNVVGSIYDNLGYGITQEGVDDLASKLTEKERAVRLDGKPDYLGNLVFPKFDREKHVKPRFKIPLDWIVDFSFDFHPSKPWAIVALATAKSGFKYVCKEFQLRGGPKFVGEEVVRWVKAESVRVGRATIDPLARGDVNAHDDAQTVYEILSHTLGPYGISLEVASKDKSNGIAMVNDLLWTENAMPGIFFFDDCVNTIKQVEDLMYDPETLKDTAMKVDDDFTECLYRLCLLDTKWFGEQAYDVSKQKSMML